MEFNQYNEAKQHLLYACNVCAPNGKVQGGFAQMVADMEKDRTPYRVALRQLAGALYDGLTYGNWPGQTHEENVQTARDR